MNALVVGKVLIITVRRRASCRFVHYHLSVPHKAIVATTSVQSLTIAGQAKAKTSSTLFRLDFVLPPLPSLLRDELGHLDHPRLDQNVSFISCEDVVAIRDLPTVSIRSF